MASRCRTAFVEPPRAITTAMAFSNASRVMICRAVMPRRNSPTTAWPDRCAKPSRRRSTAGGAAEPGRGMPRASPTAAMVFAVYIPPQAPSPGQIARSMRSTSSRVILPARHAPTASKASMIVTSRPSTCPGMIEPAYRNTDARSSRAAAISIPGSDLSQPARSTDPSSRSAIITVSTLSAMTSRDTSEKCMPSCPMEMPSETEIVPNSSGYPPAAWTPFFTALASRSSGRLHGVISFHDDATPICGLAKSSSPMPTARSMPRAAVFSSPSVTSRERGLRSGVLMVRSLLRRCRTLDACPNRGTEQTRGPLEERPREVRACGRGRRRRDRPLMTLDPQAARRATPAAGTDEQPRQGRLAALASTVGTTIEWYDFFLYNTAAALIFPALFFPESTAYAGRLESFATYAVGFAARPVGAAIFGHWGDRIGRKATLITTLLVMGISTAIVGMLPGSGSIGALAPILLVALRLLQGLAVGGEWSGSVLLSMEWGDQKRRGLMASLPQLGVAFGLILGTGFLYLLSWRLSDDQFQSWGWRIPFVFSLVMVAIGLWIRMRILETPVFARRLQNKQISRLPTVDAIRSHWKAILLSAFARLSEQAPFYVITSFTLVYLTEEQGYSKTFALAAILSAAGLEVIAVPFYGHLSDSVGRKKIYMIGAALTGVYGFVLF